MQSKDFFGKSGALGEDRTNQNDHCGNRRNQCRDLNNRFPTAVIGDRPERIRTANCARIAAKQ